MNREWAGLREVADQHLRNFSPEEHRLTRDLSGWATAWKKDLDELAECRKEMAEARAVWANDLNEWAKCQRELAEAREALLVFRDEMNHRMPLVCEILERKYAAALQAAREGQ